MLVFPYLIKTYIFNDFTSVDRSSGPPRDDIPIPTQPPFTAFIGNLAFDLTEADLEQFFSGHKVFKLILSPIYPPNFVRRLRP